MDIKLTVVAMLEAVTDLLRAGFTPQRTLLFAFGHDEEVGGRLGAGETAKLLEARGVGELDVIFVSRSGGGSIVVLWWWRRRWWWWWWWWWWWC
jgi:acetylornithine deacetylase/succinyl-diaminopimelate desuccinylase-like protein